MKHVLTEAHHRADPALAAFIEDIHDVVDNRSAVMEIVQTVAACVTDLLRTWRMPDTRYLARQPGRRYGSYLLYRAPDGSFVVVIDTFDRGQTTQIHNHRTWAVVGLLDGAERNEIFRPDSELTRPPERVAERITRPGDIFTLMEPEMHRLTTDQGAFSQSFHVYGADVGTIRRLAWDATNQRYTEFRQGWSNDAVSLPIYLDCPPLTELELRRRCAGYL
jgi:predicted metal-dependent enzyme (double-stranded beta helix superfamily)